MPKRKPKTDAELDAIAFDIVDVLRPHHLAIFEIRKVLDTIEKMLDYVVLREKPKSEE